MSREERRERIRRLLERREREGLTYRELAELSGESANTLAWWASRLRQEVGFVELVSEEDSDDGEKERLEIVLANGVRVVVPVRFEERELERVLRVAARC